MKNRLLTLAGALALVAVLGSYYAKPLLAQVRAAVTKNIDEPARVPYQAQISCSGASQCNVANGPYFTLPHVPDHSRLVLEQVNLFIQTNGILNNVQLGQFNSVVGSGPLLPPVTFLPFTTTSTGYLLNEPVKYYFEADVTPAISLGVTAPVSGASFSVSMQGMVAGYVVDLNQ